MTGRTAAACPAFSRASAHCLHVQCLPRCVRRVADGAQRARPPGNVRWAPDGLISIRRRADSRPYSSRRTKGIEAQKAAAAGDAFEIRLAKLAFRQLLRMKILWIKFCLCLLHRLFLHGDQSDLEKHTGHLLELTGARGIVAGRRAR